MITIKQIEALSSVAALGSVARAADRLHVTESALSKRLAELEQILAIEIFERSTRELRITEVGKTILELANELLVKRDAILSTANGTAFHKQTFSFGMTEFIASKWLVPIVERISTSYGELTLKPKVGLSRDLLEELMDGRLDLLIVPKTQFGDELSVMPLFESGYVWVCSPRYMLAQEPVGAHEFSKLSLIVQPNGSANYVALFKWLSEHGAPQPKQVSCNSLDGLKNLLEAGFGVALLPELYCQHEVQTGVLRTFDITLSIAPSRYVAVFRNEPQDGLVKCIAQLISAQLGTNAEKRDERLLTGKSQACTVAG